MSRFATYLHYSCLCRDFLAHTTPLNMNEHILADQYGKAERKGVNNVREEKDCSGVM